MDRREKFFGMLAVLVTLFLAVFFKLPEELITAIGVENAYFVVFLIAALGGVSSFTAASYFSTIVAFAAAGLNPILLGIVGGIGVSIGDSLFFLFGQHGRVVLSQHVEHVMDMIKRKLNRFHQFAVPLFVFFYAGFTPFPNEFMTISVGLTGTKYREIVIPLVLGNVNITILTVLGVQYATGLL